MIHRITRHGGEIAAIVLGSMAAAAAAPAPAAPAPASAPVQDAEPPAGAENAPAGDEITPELEAAIQRGFAYLVSQQNRDGSFGRGRYGRHVGITALCGIAFMADGNLPGRGPYGEQVQRALEFVISNAGDAGLLAADTSHGPMYGHGFATLFLGEIYGMNPTDDRVREALQKAVDLIVGSQNELGGWRYNPVPLDADVSVTVCQVMALRSARNAGIKVPRETIDRAVAYIRSCQNEDGGFRYMSQPGVSAWPRTAAGVATLFYAGVHEDDSIDRGLTYLTRVAMPGQRLPTQAHYYYGHYYAVQAMYLAGGDWWGRWWPAARQELLSRQHAEGGWLDHYAGGAYSTAMSLIVLQMPKRYLPIFQR